MNVKLLLRMELIITVWDCYGSTPKQAKEMAKYRINNAIAEEQIELLIGHTSIN